MNEIYPDIGDMTFYDDLYNMFADYKIDKRIIEKEVVPNFCINMGAKKEAKAYQKFVADYMSSMSQYRGLLVYHGLGSGKTRTGVRTMNTNKDMNVIIICPASLRRMWKSNVRNNKEYAKQRVYYVSYNAPNFIDQIVKVGNLNNKLIIIDESHIFFQNVISGKAKQAKNVFDKLYHSVGTKFLLMTGTPISGDPFELVPMFNLLKGKLYLDSRERRRRKIKYLPLFPIGHTEFWKNFVSEEHNSIKNVEIFKERIMGLVSYYKGLKDEYQYVVPKNLGIKLLKIPMGDIQWISFLKIRREEAKIERIYKYKTTAFKESAYKKSERKSSGTYKVNSRMASNFSVGAKVEEIYSSLPKSIRREKIDWSRIIRAYPKLKKADLPDIKLEVAEIKWKIFLGLFVDDIKSIKDLERYSGKLARLLKMISDPKKKKMKKFIYSEYRVFGTRLIAYFLTKLLGYKKIGSDKISKYKGFCIIDGDTKNKEDVKKQFNSSDNVYGEKISIILGTKVVSAGYTFKNVREIYILEPQWRDITIEQIIGRPIRLCSHQDLPIQDRNVQTYIMLSVPIKNELRNDLPRSDSGQTTDEILYDIASSKSKFIGTFLHAMKEAAVDCKLNIHVNENHKMKIRCKECKSTKKYFDNIIIPNDYRDHIISGPRCISEEVQEKLFPIQGHNPDKLKKDLNDSVYELINKIWTEVGYIKNKIIIYY